MTDSLHTIKPRVRELQPYSLRADHARVKLNQNENSAGLPVEIMQETLRRVICRPWSRYPDFVPQRLHERLAEHVGWTAKGIIAGNGSNELIQAVMMTTLEPGKRILISEPTFTLYRQIATVLGAEVLSVPLTRDFAYDATVLRRSIESQQPELVIICSPNNPTGSAISRPDLISLLKAARGLVVIDEAYAEFSGETRIPLLEQHRNLVILRTFSKAMALAGVRIGYLLTSPEVAREISKAVLPYNLNVISQTAAEVALEMYSSRLKPVIQSICLERDRLFSRLREIDGLTPVPSHANFILVRSVIEPQKVYAALLKRGILIRDVSSYPMLGDYFRVSVGTRAENDELVGALGKIFRGLARDG